MPLLSSRWAAIVEGENDITLKWQYHILQVIMASVTESGPARHYFHAVELPLMAVSPGSGPLLDAGVDVCLRNSDVKSTELESDGLNGPFLPCLCPLFDAFELGYPLC